MQWYFPVIYPMDPFDQLIQSFELTFTSEMRQYFQKVWKEKRFAKNTIISDSGDIEKYFYFITAGVQSLSVTDKNGDEVVLGFSYKGNFSGIFDSFLFSHPAYSKLTALTESVGLAITKSDYDEMLARFPVFYQWGKGFAEKILFGRGKREVEMMMMTAEERYTAFMRRCPRELLEIPQKYLASYLNMKPETFSRLRAKVDY